MSEFSSLLLPDFFLNELRINYILLSVVAKSAGPIRDRQGISTGLVIFGSLTLRKSYTPPSLSLLPWKME